MKKRPWMTPHFRFVAAILMALAITLPAAAQEQRGAIEGTVKDSSGVTIPGATVQAKSDAGTVSTVSGLDGKYQFPSLRPTRWTVTASLFATPGGMVSRCDVGGAPPPACPSSGRGC